MSPFASAAGNGRNQSGAAEFNLGVRFAPSPLGARSWLVPAERLPGERRHFFEKCTRSRKLFLSSWPVDLVAALPPDRNGWRKSRLALDYRSGKLPAVIAHRTMKGPNGTRKLNDESGMVTTKSSESIGTRERFSDLQPRTAPINTERISTQGRIWSTFTSVAVASQTRSD